MAQLLPGQKIPEYLERLDVTEIIDYRDRRGNLFATVSRPSLAFEVYRLWPADENLRRIIKLGEKYP